MKKKRSKNHLDTAGKIIQRIVCPECSRSQAAYVYETLPFLTMVHICLYCNYVIGESEWNVIETIRPEKGFRPGLLIDQVPYTEKILALSWNQPYATLMLHGKQETRSRPTKVRGLVLVCSCKKPYPNHKIQSISGHHQRGRIINMLTNEMSTELFGSAIGIGKLTGSRPMTEKDEDQCYVKYRPGLWMWVFEDVHPIEGFDWRGKQGWKEVKKEVKQGIIIK